jgi:SAM-dependent methyltransferase
VSDQLDPSLTSLQNVARSADGLQLNLGCGPEPAPGWVNVDGSWNARLAKYPRVRALVRKVPWAPKSLTDGTWPRDIVIHDLRKRLPFLDSSFACIYASHLIEHLYQVEGERLLGECHRVLKPGGVLRIVVPDLFALVNDYLHDKAQRDRRDEAADLLNEKLLFRSSAPPAGSAIYRTYLSLTDFHTHKWMYDADSMIRLLKRVGFPNPGEMAYRQSAIVGISDVERPERVLEGAGICIEATKSFSPD